MKKIKGSEVETRIMNQHKQNAIEVVWADKYDSYAFMLEQILSKLESAGYSSKEEIMSEWKIILETNNKP